MKAILALTISFVFVCAIRVQPTRAQGQEPNSVTAATAKFALLGPGKIRKKEVAHFVVVTEDENGAASVVPMTPHLVYTFNFGNGEGTVSLAPQADQMYPHRGVFNVTVTVFDESGVIGTAATTIKVKKRPAEEGA